MSSTELVIDNACPTVQLSIEEERRLIAIAQDCADERRRSWAYRKLLNQQSCQNIIKKLIRQYNQPGQQDFEELWATAREGFAKAIQRFRFDSEARLSSVVFQYVRDCLQSLNRKEYNHRRAISELKNEAPVYTPEPEVIDTYQIKTVQKLIPQLLEDQQKVVELRTNTDLTLEEIGNQLGKSAGAISKHFQRAIAKLREMLFIEPSCPVSEPRPITTLSGAAAHLCQTAIAHLKHAFFNPAASEPVSADDPQPQQYEEIPMDATQTQSIAKRQRSFIKSIKRHSMKLWYTAGLTTALWLDSHPAANACVGWLCGPKEKMSANDIFKEAQAKILLDGVFLFLQFFALVIVAIPILSAVLSGARREDYGGYILASVAVFLALTFVNFLAGYLFGATGTTTTAFLPVPFPGA